LIQATAQGLSLPAPIRRGEPHREAGTDSFPTAPPTRYPRRHDQTTPICGRPANDTDARLLEDTMLQRLSRRRIRRLAADIDTRTWRLKSGIVASPHPNQLGFLPVEVMLRCTANLVNCSAAWSGAVRPRTARVLKYRPRRRNPGANFSPFSASTKNRINSLKIRWNMESGWLKSLFFAK
jgi:hypothetical protein